MSDELDDKCWYPAVRFHEQLGERLVKTRADDDLLKATDPGAWADTPMELAARRERAAAAALETKKADFLRHATPAPEPEPAPHAGPDDTEPDTAAAHAHAPKRSHKKKKAA